MLACIMLRVLYLLLFFKFLSWVYRDMDRHRVERYVQISIIRFPFSVAN